jgi:Serine dehydrogenase proteinase
MIEATTALTAGENRRALITELEHLRGSRVVCYVLSDRPGATAQIADDAVRPLYDHLRAIGRCEKLDLFLYSIGGLTDVPWRIVSMIRESAKTFDVLVPYRAMSAATMIALGADHILMGPKGELGPIDPQFSVSRGREGETPVQDQIAVEDIMSYLRLLRDRVGLSDQAALAAPIAALADKLDPVFLGQAYRAHSHIRNVARKLMASRTSPADEQVTGLIVETLAEKTYQHGHAIGRKEAKAIGLPVVNASEAIEDAMWRLLESYEELLETRAPVDAEAALSGEADRATLALTMGAIESRALAHRFGGQFQLTRQRQTIPQLNLNLQLGLNLPPGFDPTSIPPDVQAFLQQVLVDAQKEIARQVEAEMRKAAPAIGFQGRLQTKGWQAVADWSAT